ncbi:MAG: phage baseplate assembly protein V [Flavobacteriaceae bacterium]|nr:phage baseplate assembly protein V [Flavobacteriaceae bacterium]
MALQSNTQIYIGGKEITTFKKLSIHQQIDAHHLLNLECRMDVLEKISLDIEVAEETKNFLGQTIVMEIASLDNLGYKKLEFKGIVTQIKNVKGYGNGAGDVVIITAKSPTFLADDGPHFASHNDISISEIIEKTFREYDTSKLELQINPVDDDTIHYSVQQNESCYDYAKRLAAQYGKWFYYNGKKLIFGKPETEELTLTYGLDLKEYHLSLIPQSHNYKYYTKDYLLDEIHEKDTKEITSGANGYSGFVANKANTIYSKETKVWHNLYNDPNSKNRLDKSIELQKKAIEIQQVKLTGVSDNPGVALGNIVKIEGGRYRVTSIIHNNNENGDYYNSFEAITAEFDAYPNTNIQKFPTSQSQTAIVVKNDDPKGLGRIKVQFPWQKSMAEMTPWIRIVTAHAGGDKGFQFIPELKEEVLIDFEGGNAEKPYMLGSLYHGTAKPDSWKTKANDIKAIKTRSGHTIEFNDAKEGEFILITDKNGNAIKLDTVGKTITIEAPEHIFLSSKNISLKATENINLESGENYRLKTKELKEQITGSAQIHVDNSIKEVSKTHEKQTEEITFKVSSKVDIQTPDFNHGV